MRSISLFQILVSLGTLGCAVYSLPLAGTSGNADSTSASILPNRPTGARFPKRTSAISTLPSTQARVTGRPQARAQVEVDPDEYLSNLASYYRAYAEEPGTSLLAEMASYTANNNPDVVDEAYLSSAEAMLSAATVAAGENAGALTEAIGDAFTALFDYKSDGNNDQDNEGVKTVQNGVTYWSEGYKTDATSSQTEPILTTNGDIFSVVWTGSVVDGQTSWSMLTGESGQTATGPSSTSASSSSSLTTTSASEQTGVIMTTVNGIPYAYSMVDGQTSWISLNRDSGQTTTGTLTTGTSSSLSTTAMTSQQTEVNGGASDSLIDMGLVACPTFTGENGMYIKCFGGSAQTTGTAVGGETSLTTTSVMTTSIACPACDTMDESYVPSAERIATS